VAKIEIRVSDLSGRQIEDEGYRAQLVVERHPNFSEPITLDVLPKDISSQIEERDEDFVVLTYYPPEEEQTGPQQVLMPLDEFNTLSTQGDMNEVLENAHRAQEEEQRSRRRVTRRSAGGRRQQQDTRRRERVDYTSAEHAGEPHRGTVSEREAEYVRNNLDEVNARLRQRGHREIDPNDPKMAADYGFPPPVGRSEVEERVEEEEASPS